MSDKTVECRNVMVVGGDYQVRDLFINRGGWKNVPTLADADLVCFTGGADVHPTLYDHPKHRSTFCDEVRDSRELAIFENATKKGVAMVGICRGGQFLNVMNGGKMFQDVTDHTRPHFLVGDGLPINLWATSTHHQMMRPTNEGKVLAYGPSSNVTYWDEITETWASHPVEKGIEVVMYNKSLCFQPHPEMHQRDPQFAPLRNYFFQCVDSLLATKP